MPAKKYAFIFTVLGVVLFLAGIVIIGYAYTYPAQLSILVVSGNTTTTGTTYCYNANYPSTTISCTSITSTATTCTTTSTITTTSGVPPPPTPLSPFSPINNPAVCSAYVGVANIPQLEAFGFGGVLMVVGLILIFRRPF